MYENDLKIFVYDDGNREKPVLMGILYSNVSRGKETFSFEYDIEWLKIRNTGILFDPDLNFYEGRQYPPDDKNLFSIFLDSCPDRWGRLLMNRKQVIDAKKQDRKPKYLMERDYLLGVFDPIRMGALRFSLEKGGPFLSSDESYSIPPFIKLRSLEAASLAFERNDNYLEEKWLNEILVPGSSLGGARPKASVVAPDGSLWIAKFPSKHDEWNYGAWEAVVNILAKKCDIQVPDSDLLVFSDAGGTFLTKRFDRDENNCRIHFLSAMNLLGRTDGADTHSAGYLDIASFIRMNGARPKQDLNGLWKRIIFNIAVSNTDDHLRNHGFLLTDKGWILSPMYDVNPDIYKDHLSLNISGNDNSLSFELALETAHFYDLDLGQAKETVEFVKKTVSANWVNAAVSCGLDKKSISFMESAFDVRFK